MNRVGAIIILAALTSLRVPAQRLDGCPEHPGGGFIVAGPSQQDAGQSLRASGVADTREAQAAALMSSRPDLRSLAALKLGLRGDKADLELLVRAELAEKDECTPSTQVLNRGSRLFSRARRRASDRSVDAGTRQSERSWGSDGRNLSSKPDVQDASFSSRCP